LGEIKNGTYHNRFFGMTVSLPPEWSVLDNSSMKQLVDLGAKSVAGKNESLKAKLDTAAKQYVTLITVSKYPMGAAANATVTCVAEPVSQVPSIQTAADYLFRVKELAQKSAIKCTIRRDITSEWIGGKLFGVMGIDLINSQNTTIHQTHHVALIKGYALTVLESSENDDDADACGEVIESIKWDK
jgi:hypothetical protein